MVIMLKVLSFVCLVSVPNTDTTALRRTQPHQHNNNYHFRVHEGRDVRDGEYPFVIVLVTIWKDMFLRVCTGSMILDTWGITAAHCSWMKPKMKLYVAYDNFTQSSLDSGCRVPVIEIFSHPSFRGLTTDHGRKDVLVNNDISLFRSESVPKKPYGVLLSADYSTLIGLPVVYVGGGATKWELEVEDHTKPLQLGEATIINCDEKMRSISKFIICLASKCSNRMQNSWYGDSGGPLIYDGKIIGVCSYGIESKIMVRHGYAPVSPYINWIQHVMNVTGA